MCLFRIKVSIFWRKKKNSCWYFLLYTHILIGIHHIQFNSCILCDISYFNISYGYVSYYISYFSISAYLKLIMDLKILSLYMVGTPCSPCATLHWFPVYCLMETVNRHLISIAFLRCTLKKITFLPWHGSHNDQYGKKHHRQNAILHPLSVSLISEFFL